MNKLVAKKAKAMVSGLIVLVVLSALALLYYDRNKIYSVDDSFITYRYAFNLMQGDGLVFNLNEKYYGTTAAGYAVVLAGANKLAAFFDNGLSTQNVSVMLSALALLLISFCAYRMAFRRNGYLILSLLAAITFAIGVFVTVPFNEVAGHETYAFLAGALLGTLLASQGRMLAAGIIIAIATTFRPDAVLFAPIICLAYIIFNQVSLRKVFVNKQLVLFSGGFFTIILPWLIFLQSYFGRPFPGTMDAKKAQILMGYWPTYDIKTLLQYVLSNLNLTVGFVLMVGVACFVVGLFLIRKNDQLESEARQSLFVGSCWLVFLLLSVSFYLSINVTFWHWYGIPAVFALAVIAYSGYVAYLPEGNDTGTSASVAVTLLVLIACALLLTNYGVAKYWAANKNINPHISAYFETADYLKKIEPEGAVIEMAEPGSFAMRLGSKFTIVDELGLITPGVAKAYLKGDPGYATREYKPKYIVCSWLGTYSACSKPEIIEKYTLVGEFDKGFWGPFLKQGAKLYRVSE
ncbi:hypothetical protein [Pseudomonas sp. PH1b]|uniref:hypothetical protein n=1 Tax=Pseudomonas sp. PH1b TaxID=1397282 RepID=UPI0012FEFC2B|nr:hypothetical protein [Pseudomonas sp. PH1b]